MSSRTSWMVVAMTLVVVTGVMLLSMITKPSCPHRGSMLLDSAMEKTGRGG